MFFYFVRYLERQVVLFDSAEDALFEKTHELNGAGSLNHLLLLEDNPASRASIRLREDVVQPLIAIQQYALQQLRAGHLSPEQEAVFRKLVLRAMFGIINAARNAA